MCAGAYERSPGTEDEQEVQIPTETPAIDWSPPEIGSANRGNQADDLVPLDAPMGGQLVPVALDGQSGSENDEPTNGERDHSMERDIEYADFQTTPDRPCNIPLLDLDDHTVSDGGHQFGTPPAFP